MSERYFLCARKLTDVEDKQVLSIEAQLAELRAYGKQERLEIVDELVEKQHVSIMRPLTPYWVRIPDPQPFGLCLKDFLGSLFSVLALQYG